MGCDIHIYTEKWIDGEWQCIDKKYKNEDAEEYDTPKYNREPIYSSRNYRLFSILADVRNAFDIEPISYPKGLPDDVSDFVKEWSADWGVDGHSRSFLTVQELLDYKWNKPIDNFGGYIHDGYYDEWAEKRGAPVGWCGYVGGRDVIRITEKDYLKVRNKGKLDPSKYYYVFVEWSETPAEVVGSFYTKTIPQLKELCDAPDYSDVRIVFWFDN